MIGKNEKMRKREKAKWEREEGDRCFLSFFFFFFFIDIGVFAFLYNKRRESCDVRAEARERQREKVNIRFLILIERGTSFVRSSVCESQEEKKEKTREKKKKKSPMRIHHTFSERQRPIALEMTMRKSLVFFFLNTLMTLTKWKTKSSSRSWSIEKCTKTRRDENVKLTCCCVSLSITSSNLHHQCYIVVKFILFSLLYLLWSFSFDMYTQVQRLT